MIPYGGQNISEADIAAVIDVLKSDCLTQGPAVPRFEAALVNYVGANHAVAVNSGTSALHLACLALGLGTGDWLWVTPITFVASANCGLYCGAKVDFVDIDPQSWNVSVERLREKLSWAKCEGKLPKVLVVVHLCGLPCDMEAIAQLSQEFGFSIIEDACHAIGGKYKGEPIGNCKYSDITVFSFHPVKNMTTGEGGVAMTNDVSLAEAMSLLRSHGVTKDPAKMVGDPDGPWYYQQLELGFNYRITELQAALGTSQLSRLDGFIEKRHQMARRYDQLLQGLPLQLPYRSTELYSGFHLYVVRMKGGGHRQVFEYLHENGVGAQLHYIPVHTQPYYKKMGFSVGDYPEAESYYAEAVSLPLYPDLEEKQQDQVVAVFKKAIQEQLA